MDVDDKDFYLVRKNLNTLSVLILILAFTNAKVNIINFAGVNIDLNGSKLYIALYTCYLYFIWRFLTKLPLVSGFWTDFLKYYFESYSGANMNKAFKKYKKDLIANRPQLDEILKTDKAARLLKIELRRLEGNKITHLRLVASFWVSKDPSDKYHTNDLSSYHDIVLSPAFLLRKLIVFCFRYDKFGDYLFPMIPILTNIIFILLKFDWQGSLINLMGLGEIA